MSAILFRKRQSDVTEKPNSFISQTSGVDVTENLNDFTTALPPSRRAAMHIENLFPPWRHARYPKEQ
jgi:hypothetical protein